MKAICVFLFSLVIIACSDNDSGLFFTPSLTFEANLSGEQEVPRVDNNTNIKVLVNVDERLKQLSASFSATNITGHTMAHIHSAFAGQNGPVLFPFKKSGDVYSLREVNVTDEQLALFKQGKLYINLHSSAHPAGVLRGQILSDDFNLMLFDLSGNQEVPSITTAAKGYGYSTFNTITKALSLSIFTIDADEATAAHIHDGRVGINGDVIIPLIQDSSKKNTWSTKDNQVLSSENSAKLLDAGLYVNLHTPSHASGEIRGQIITLNHRLLAFDLASDQEVPAVTSTATGDGYGILKLLDQSLELRLITTNADDATAAHIHTANIGVNGSVLVTLDQNATNKGVWTSPANTRLSDSDLATLLAGGLYANVHTPAIPSGEIRGQILTENFRVFAFPLSGQQEVPPVTTNASGDGYVLVDTKDKAITQLRAISRGVSNATMAHIHEAPSGSNGPVFTALQRDTSDVNIWTISSKVSLADEKLSAILAGNMYTNIHTPANPAGEIRGQIVP